MAKSIKINNVTYNAVSSVSVPLAAGGGNAVFPDTSDANATATDIATGKTAYVNGVKITGAGTGGGSEVISGSFVGDGTKEFPISLSVSRVELMQRTAICIFTTDWNGSTPEMDEVGMLISFCGLIPDDLINYSEIIGNGIWVDVHPVNGPFFNADMYLNVIGSYFSPPVTFELEDTPVFKDGATYNYVIW